jgi:hypothetical protein
MAIYSKQPIGDRSGVIRILRQVFVADTILTSRSREVVTHAQTQNTKGQQYVRYIGTGIRWRYG